MIVDIAQGSSCGACRASGRPRGCASLRDLQYAFFPRAQLHQAKRYDIPSFPLTQGLFSHIGQLMRSSIVVAPSEDSTVVTVTYAGLKAYRDQLDRLVWLALQRARSMACSTMSGSD